jgi:hypothetical protein
MRPSLFCLVCPGRHLAITELSTLAAHIIRNFEFDMSTFGLHKRLDFNAPDLAHGPRVVGSRIKIADVDGTIINAMWLDDCADTGMRKYSENRRQDRSILTIL